jgi:hypothetical protein
VDNSNVAQYVTMIIAGTGQVLTFPPNTQSVMPLFFTGTPLFSISVSTVSASVTRLLLLNVPLQSSNVWQAVS